MDADPVDRVEQLAQRVAHLDREVARLRTRLGAIEAPVSQVDQRIAAATPASRAPWPAPQPMAPAPVQTTPTRVHLDVDSETVLKWGGVGLVLLAVGFAVSTAISRDWIGPELQLAGALAVSAALVVTGLRLRTTRPNWTHALCSGGVLAFFTTFASDLFLDRADATIGFVATAVVAAGGLALARTIRSEWVAAATLIGGSIGWVVIIASLDDAPFIATTIWFSVFVGATITLSIECDWFAARPAAHAVGMITLLALSGAIDGSGDQAIFAIATVLLAGSLFFVPSIGDLTSPWQQLEVQLAALTAPWAFAVTLVAFLDGRSDTVIALCAFAIAAITAFAGVVLPIRRPHLVSLLVGASITFSIGLAVLLSTTAVFVALAVQAAGLVILSGALGRNLRVLVNAIVLAAIASINTFAAMVDAWSDNAPWGDDIAHFLVLAALMVGIWYLDERVVRRAGSIAMLALLLVWLGSVFVHAPQGQAVVSVVWATVGTVVFVTGAVTKRADAASTGLAVIALTVGKLLTVDLREVDTLWRAGLFFLVGVGLLRLGFLLPRLTRPDTETDDASDTERQDHDTPVGADS